MSWFSYVVSCFIMFVIYVFVRSLLLSLYICMSLLMQVFLYVCRPLRRVLVI